MARICFVLIKKPLFGRGGRRMFVCGLVAVFVLTVGLSSLPAQAQQSENSTRKPKTQQQGQSSEEQAQARQRQNVALENAGDRTIPRHGTAKLETNGFRFTPFVVFSTRYDDNIFISSSNRQSDTILTLRPGFAVRYLSDRTDFHFNYGVSAEKYLRHSDLDSWDEEQGGSIGASHWFSARFNGGLDASYFETHNPQRLTPVTGIVVGRNRATRATITPSFVYQFSPITNLRAFYQYARDDLSGGERTNIGTASAAVTHELDPRDTLQFEYQNIHYNFSTAENVNSNLFTVGWDRELSRSLSLELRAGPRDTGGRWVPDILAGINYRSGTTGASVDYRRTQRAVIGQTQVLDVQGLTAFFSFVPIRHLTFELRPGYFHNSGSGVSSNVWRLGLDLWYTFARGWSVGFTDSYARQSGALNSQDSVVRRNVVGIALRFGLPSPGRRYLGAELPVPGEAGGP